MTNDKIKPRCEVCGEEPVVIVRDVAEKFNYLTGEIEKEPLGDPHLFCKNHGRDSKTVDVTKSLM